MIFKLKCRKIPLRKGVIYMSENNKVEFYSKVIKQVIDKEITQKVAAEKLELSIRQIQRLVDKYKKMGDAAFVHQNTGKESHNKKIPDDIANEIINDYLSDYSDFEFTHYYEEQGYKFGISFSSMVTIFANEDIISPYAQHETIKLYNEKMKKSIRENTITQEKQDLFEQRKQEEFEKHIRKSTLKYSFGEEVQMDAAFWNWFGDIESALHLAVDKATKKVLAGQFDYEETTNAYTIVLMDTILNHGIPHKIKTDKRNSFSINNARSSKTKLNTTQFGRMCEDLNITLLCSSNPLFKPNAERENGTFKRRLKAELRCAGITEPIEANKYLNEIFIPKINARFSYDINQKKNMMKDNKYTLDELNFIISIRNERTIDNASSLKFSNKYYIPVNQETGEIVSFKSGTKCIVVKTFDNKLLGIINEDVYSLLEVEQQDTIKTNASRNGFKPSSDNPWGKFKIK